VGPVCELAVGLTLMNEGVPVDVVDVALLAGLYEANR
jgi:hypothetical protein